MIVGPKRARWVVRLTVARRGGWRAWGPVSGGFERQLAARASSTIVWPRVDSVARRGPDFVRVTISMTVSGADVAEALTTGWWAFRKAAGDDITGWDLASAAADVRPGGALDGTAAVPMTVRASVRQFHFVADPGWSAAWLNQSASQGVWPESNPSTYYFVVTDDIPNARYAGPGADWREREYPPKHAAVCVHGHSR